VCVQSQKHDYLGPRAYSRQQAATTGPESGQFRRSNLNSRRTTSILTMKNSGSQWPLWVIDGLTIRPIFQSLSVVAPIADKRERGWFGREVPCVDGPELARAFFTFAGLVGAAMCSAFECG
jgi:hypothetical protein